MQKWEYARLIINFGKNKYCRFIHYAAEGPRSSTIKKEGMFSKEPDYWGEFDQRVIQLGLEGWELVGVAPLAEAVGISTGGAGATREWHLWFKRPIGGQQVTERL